MITDGVYKTNDLVSAAVLSMNGINPRLELDGGDGKTVVFVFDLKNHDEEYVEGLLTDLNSSSLEVEPKRFAREWRYMRSQVVDFMRQAPRLRQAG